MIWLNLWKLKRNLKKLLEIEKSKENYLSARWGNMLCKKNKTIVLEANSSEELSKEWDEFYKNNGSGRLGSVRDIDDKQFYVNNEKFYLMVQYTTYSLREGFSNDEYELTVNEYDEIHARVEELKETILYSGTETLIAIMDSIKDVKCPRCGKTTSNLSALIESEDDTRAIVTCLVNGCEFFEYSGGTMLEAR